MTTQKPDLGELLRRVPDWSGRACADVDPEIFFPDPGRPAHDGPTQVALACCARCPIRQECLDYALTTKQQYGIWGGKTEEQRKLLRPGARATAPPVARRRRLPRRPAVDPAEQRAHDEASLAAHEAFMAQLERARNHVAGGDK